MISEKTKIELSNVIERSNNFIIVTTGRAGSDFLQSCFDLHPEVASTAEKSQSIKDLIIKYKNSVLRYSIELFAHLAVEHLLLSFLPNLNIHEDWQIKYEDNFKKANVNLFTQSLKHLLSLREFADLDNLYIVRSIIISFTVATGKDLSKIKSILCHLHSINLLNFYKDSLTNKDLIIVCSRGIFNLLNSGVNNWRDYFFKKENYLFYSNIYHYRKIYTRTALDYSDIKKQLKNNKVRVRISMLEKLSDLHYLNKINKLLLISSFNSYPKSTIFGIKRRADLVSNNRGSNSQGEYNKSIVFRGTPIDLLGLTETLVLSIIHANRIKKYAIDSDAKLVKRIINLKDHTRFFLFHIFIIFPTKIEFQYYRSLLKSFILSLKKEKNIFTLKGFKLIRQYFYYVICYAIDYFLMRLERRGILLKDISKAEILKEL